MASKGPVGVFDSGVGGLSITRYVRRELPSEDIVYVADLSFSPYGNKSTAVIESRAEYIVDFLCDRGCKAIVVACNTATVNTINKLREKFDVPIVGVEPGIKPAALQSKTGVIAVLATEQTIKSVSFNELRSRFSDQVKIEVQACPNLVKLVESGDLDSENSAKVVSDYVLPLLEKEADHVVLGCTHYSFLSPVIERVVAGRATIVDTAQPVALELKNRLLRLELLSPCDERGGIQFFSTELSSAITERIGRLWGQSVDVREV